MNISYPSVHQIDAPPVNNEPGDENVVGVRMTGISDTRSGLAIRLFQVIIDVATLNIIASTHSFITTMILDTLLRLLASKVCGAYPSQLFIYMPFLWAIACGIPRSSSSSPLLTQSKIQSFNPFLFCSG